MAGQAYAGEAGGELRPEVQRVVRTERCRQFSRRDVLRLCRHKRNGAAESTVAIRRSAHTTLYLSTAEQSTETIHIGPKDALVFRRIEGHAIEGDVDTRACRATYAHVGGTGAHSVLAPCQHTGRTGEEERQFPACLGELLKLLFLDVCHGKRCVFGCTHTLHRHLSEILYAERVVVVCLYIAVGGKCRQGDKEYFLHLFYPFIIK